MLLAYVFNVIMRLLGKKWLYFGWYQFLGILVEKQNQKVCEQGLGLLLEDCSSNFLVI